MLKSLVLINVFRNCRGEVIELKSLYNGGIAIFCQRLSVTDSLVVT